MHPLLRKIQIKEFYPPKRIVFSVTLFSSLLSLLFILPAEAAFSLKATPYEGGTDLRFGKVQDITLSVRKEITINVTSDIGKQYQVIQQLIQPLSDTRGSEIGADNFMVYADRGSNAPGTLNIEAPVGVTQARTLLYTSDSAGTSDSFVLVYNLSVPQGQEPGFYQGRISYILQPKEGTQSPQIVNINITALVESSAAVKITTTSGTKTLTLKESTLPAEKEQEVLIKIIGNLGQPYRIIQEIPQSLSSQDIELTPEAVVYETSGGENGTLAQAGKDFLKTAPVVLYNSNARGDADSIGIKYSLGGITAERAGKYAGKLIFYLETASTRLKAGRLETLDLIVDIEPRFDLIVTITGGQLVFKDLKPAAEPQIKEVLIKIDTNLGEPYQVTQRVSGPLINPEGYEIPQNYFKLKTTAGEEELSGTLKQPAKTPIKTGETAFYISDVNGEPAEFKIIYELTVPRDIHAGDYSTAIVYSLSEK